MLSIQMIRLPSLVKNIFYKRKPVKKKTGNDNKGDTANKICPSEESAVPA
jgi:hypothetical protein